MQILLASAKTMNDRLTTPSALATSTPRFAQEATVLALEMTAYHPEQIAQMLGCNLQIAVQNKLRFMRFTEDTDTLPAIFAYRGQAYKHLKAVTLTPHELHFAQEHLFITSFLYGLLRPLDTILPYRMEGNVSLPITNGQNMFGFWKSRLTDVLIDAVKADDGILVHLATEEYQHLFDWRRVRREVQIIQPLFYVRQNNRLIMQAVWAKTCRGAMARFIIGNRFTSPADLNTFAYEGFAYSPAHSEEAFPNFIKATSV